MPRFWREILSGSLALLLAGCAGYGGPPLTVGVAGEVEVVAALGQPALRWRDADGSQQLAFPRGPQGTHTYMAFLGPDGRLQRLENVLDSAHFARLQAGSDDVNSVLRLLGPPNPEWTVTFPARDELAWQWLICDDWNMLSRFTALFDASSGRLRSTMQLPELRGRDGVAPICSH